MAGYSQTPLVKKLGLKSGQRVLFVNAPKNFLDELDPLPRDLRFASLKAKTELDFILFFVDSSKTLQKQLPTLKQRLISNGLLWVSWPKKSSGMPTDLSFDIVQHAGLKIGLVDVKICAVNDTWSGLKFVYRLKDRKWKAIKTSRRCKKFLSKPIHIKRTRSKIRHHWYLYKLLIVGPHLATSQLLRNTDGERIVKKNKVTNLQKISGRCDACF